MSVILDGLTRAADANQARASDPAASAWVSANAGTGKTEVLVKRVLRLLLAGSPPERILCLTYTKMAAAEMQNRLLKELARLGYAARSEVARHARKLLRREPNDDDLRIARRLFATALEAKGGLKIYTIHGFCERLLQRFPLEADVTPHFTVLDERGAALLRRAAFDRIIARAADDKDSALGKALARIITRASEEPVRQVVDCVLAKRAEFDRMVVYHGGGGDWPAAECAALRQLFGIGAEEDEASLTAQLASVLDEADIDAALLALERHALTERVTRLPASGQGRFGRSAGGGAEARLSHREAGAAQTDMQRGAPARGARPVRAAGASANAFRRARSETRASRLRRGERRRAHARRRDPSGLCPHQARRGRARL